MAAIISIILFGAGLIAGGFLYQLFDDILIDFIVTYVYDSNSAYYLGSQLVWDAIPYVMILGGLACILYAGMRYRQGAVY